MRTGSSAVLLILLSLLTKPIGFVKEIVVAALYGAGPQRDAYLVAWQIPNLLGSFVAEGLPQVLVPFIAEERAKSSQASAIASLMNLFLVGFVVASLCILVFPGFWVSLVAPFLGGETHALAARLLRILSPSVIFIGSSALLSALLYARKSFIVPSLTVPCMSAVILAFILLGTRDLGIRALAWGTLCGTLAMVLLQVHALKGAGYRPRVKLDAGTRRFFALGGTFLAGTVLFGLIAVVEKIFASRLPAGSISCLDYASRLAQVIYMILGMITLSVFPNLCETAVEETQRLEFQRLLERALRALLFLALPAALFLAVFSDPVVRLIYQRGAFETESTRITANLLVFYAAGSVFFILNNLFVHAFYARREMAVRVQFAALQLLVFVGTATLLVRLLGVRGLALAHLAAAGMGHVFLAALLWRRGTFSPGVALRAALSFLGISLLAVGAGWLAGHQFGALVPGKASLVVPLGVASAVFFIAAYSLRIPELHYVVDLAGRVVKRWRT